MGKVILQDVRCSFVFAHNQRKNKEDGSPGGYGVQVILPKGSKDEKKLQKEVQKVLREAVGEAKAKKLGMYKLPLRDGDIRS